MINERSNKDKIDNEILHTYTPFAWCNIDRILF